MTVLRPQDREAQGRRDLAIRLFEYLKKFVEAAHPADLRPCRVR
jgi:hypothetical protein